MKTILLATVVWVLAGRVGYAQGRAVEAGSAEAAQRLEEHRQRLAAQKAEPNELLVDGLKVGALGIPMRIDAKVMQVIDDAQMLVGIEDARTGNGNYKNWILIKCPTTGITDGKFWRGGQWKEVTGAEALAVTGTTTYNTAGGGTKTVFVVEPLSKEGFDELVAKEREAAEAALFRTWTDDTGTYQVVAQFLEFRGGRVHLERKDNHETIDLPMSRFSKQDQEWIRDELKRRREKDRQPGP